MLKVFLCVFTKLREETLNFKLLLISPVEVRGAGEAYIYTDTSTVNVLIFIRTATCTHTIRTVKHMQVHSH